MCDRWGARWSGVVRAARRWAVAGVCACLLVACGGQGTTETAPEERGPGASPGTSATPSVTSAPSGEPTRGPSASAPAESLPAFPVTDDAAVLIRQLDTAVSTLRDPDASDAEVRRAGEFQQLAARALARAPASFRQRVIDMVRPATAQVTRGDVRAAGLLTSMTDPRPALPDWRIVAPPPPSRLLDHYREAQRRIGVHWTYLAAIHLVETRMGRIRGVSTAGARGPMQFLPSTWEVYGAGGDIDDPQDAILAAARLLKANGAPGNMSDALWHYNPSASYVRAVMEYARTMRRTPALYRGYWHWRVLYRHVRGTLVLPVGYPQVRPLRVAD